MRPACPVRAGVPAGPRPASTCSGRQADSHLGPAPAAPPPECCRTGVPRPHRCPTPMLSACGALISPRRRGAASPELKPPASPCGQPGQNGPELPLSPPHWAPLSGGSPAPSPGTTVVPATLRGHATSRPVGRAACPGLAPRALTGPGSQQLTSWVLWIGTPAPTALDGHTGPAHVANHATTAWKSLQWFA